ncbi:methyltransferase domain-containing protein [Streptomyces sp. ALI-76-A]|uniref:class I SAM-dependent RNA methyltransferase n=1 Tax=Streptomyces sp. ALI-76-A TaxID=3025736 RepID=UPI00256F3608|nr:methyltransferase domain-containing protein [Streptomyces sp. ALI-76-A]MDL5204274.1 methyltransferase domain-containing protein [Streptomyces sp. ALI-76-A]
MDVVGKAGSLLVVDDAVCPRELVQVIDGEEVASPLSGPDRGEAGCSSDCALMGVGSRALGDSAVLVDFDVARGASVYGKSFPAAAALPGSMAPVPHAKPGAQRRLKGEVVAEQLQRLAGLTPEEAGWDGTVLPAEGDKVPAGQVPQWRTRVQYAVDPDGNAGLRRHRSHEVEPIDHCMIAAEGVSELGIEKRDWAGMESVEAIAATGSQDRMVILEPRPGARLPLVELDRPVSVMRVEEHDGGIHRVHGRAFVRERADGRTHRVGSGGFWQVHPKAADTLVTAVMQGLLPRKGDMALDLYCGVGLFAGALADRLGDQGAVLGIESGKRAVEDARHNLAGFDRVRIEQGKVESVLPRTGITEVDLIVLDPPRAGAGRRTVGHLASLGARKIAYVACDPAALARDLGYFRDGGYRVRTLRVFDLFPMTHHVECVAILEPVAKGS